MLISLVAASTSSSGKLGSHVAGRIREHLNLSGVLKRSDPDHDLGDCWADHHNTVVLEQDRAALEAPDLVPILQNYRVEAGDVWLFYPRRKQVPVVAQIFLDFAKSRISADKTVRPASPEDAAHYRYANLTEGTLEGMAATDGRETTQGPNA